ncbi:MAG: hypothetical protein ACRD8Z_15635 [Nitrososphaeraceae archaeon]
MASKKKPDPNIIKEVQALQRIFGTDLSQWEHTGYQRSELPYTARDAAAGAERKKRNRK